MLKACMIPAESQERLKTRSIVTGTPAFANLSAKISSYSKSSATTPLSISYRVDSTTNLLDRPKQDFKLLKDSNEFRVSFFSSLNNLADHPESSSGGANHEEENPELQAPASYLVRC